MNKTSITDDRTARYICANLENANGISYTELKAKDHVQIYLYKDLPNIEIEGYPVASDFVDEKGKCHDISSFNSLTTAEKAKCELRYHYLPYLHELYIGSTGSGKTTGCLEPQLRAITSQKNKPNLFLSDPKGELFERNSRHLVEHGYRTYILNFKDITHSDKWNPLLEIYEKKVGLLTFGKNRIHRIGAVDPELTLNTKIENFSEDGYFELDSIAFANDEDINCYIELMRDYLEAQIDELVNQFACMIIKIENKNDPTWEAGAIQLLKGIVFCMLDDAFDMESGFTKEMMTINTVCKYYDRLRCDIAGELRLYNLNTHPLLKNKSKKTKMCLSIALDNAPKTMLNYCGVFETATRAWFQGHIFALTTGNTIELSDNSDSPYAIFVSTRDYEKSDFTVAGLFVDWVYKWALENAEKSVKKDDGKPSTRAFHFLLDEFGNIPEIRDFENKISTSRSRNIWFHLFVQSFEQLELVYSKEKAAIICDNCNGQIFLGAQSRNSKERFSKECGVKWIPSIQSAFEPNDTSLLQVSVLPVSALDLLEEGEQYNKRIYTNVIKARYIRSYNCAKAGAYAHFYDKNAYVDFAPTNKQAFNGDKCTFKKLADAPKKK